MVGGNSHTSSSFLRIPGHGSHGRMNCLWKGGTYMLHRSPSVSGSLTDYRFGWMSFSGSCVMR